VTKTVTDKNSVLYGKKVKLFYASDGSQIQDAQKIVGSGVTYQLYVNRGKNMVTAYVKDGSCYIPVKAFICSTGGSNTPLGTFSTKAKYRWHELMGPCWGQWCTRIHGGVLFHSVYYSTINDNQTLSVSAYNKLGTTASHGCVRLTAASAKWIYDNCPTGATVVIYEKSGYEPLKKPTAYKLSASHRWDPTDPNMAYKCKQNGCH
jgi:lipoprotein-anchoring transpeptidase ErfK/SrfK